MIDNIDGISVAELAQGYRKNSKSGEYICNFCGERREDGFIYPHGERFADARKAMEAHISDKHDGVFEALLAEGKRNTGLTDTQAELMLRFYRRESDASIARETGLSPSTVRHQRFSLREKARRAKYMLALSGLISAPEANSGGALLEVPSFARMVDERYMTTEDEARKIIAGCFASTDPPVLRQFPPKEKKKLVVLKIIAEQFSPGVRYGEKQVNEILKAIHPDFATLRRYLIEYGFMERTPDCSEYTVKENENG